jgi:hypothetical protein
MTDLSTITVVKGKMNIAIHKYPINPERPRGRLMLTAKIPVANNRVYNTGVVIAIQPGT